MKKVKQEDLIKQLSDQEILFHLLLTQGIVLLLSIVGSFFLFPSLSHWLDLFKWDISEISKYGITAAAIVIGIDLILMKVLPKKYYDDGGINEKVFKTRSFLEILIITIIVAISEELLFRGVLQTVFGYFIASFIFAIMHIRYLTKIVLLISVLLVSFYLGWIYAVTENLWVTIVAHFAIDFILALIIRYKK